MNSFVSKMNTRQRIEWELQQGGKPLSVTELQTMLRVPGDEIVTALRKSSKVKELHDGNWGWRHAE